MDTGLRPGESLYSRVWSVPHSAGHSNYYYNDNNEDDDDDNDFNDDADFSYVKEFSIDNKNKA